MTQEPPATECAVAVPDEAQPAHVVAFDCIDCIGMREHGCYCAAMGATSPDGPPSNEHPRSAAA